MTETEAPHALFERDGHVAIITLNRPHVGNALTPTMLSLVSEYWQEIRSNPDIRCTVITGTGDRYFCTGADLQSVAASGKVIGGYGRITEEVRYTSRQNDIWKPTVCAVNGTVVGGGLHFVVDSDVVVASDNAEFIDTHTTVGLVGAIENIGLAKRLPLGTALRMTLQGKSFRLPAARAYALGLVDELVPVGGALESAMGIAQEIAKNSPNAVSLSMRSVWSSTEMPYTQAVEYGYSLMRMHWSHPDFKEGPRAFAEKREPQWTTD